MEGIYNKWQLQDKDLGNTERYQFTKSELLDFAKYYHNQQLIMGDVSKSLPTIIEIDFDGHLKCQIETTDKAPTILKAVNGYGQAIDCNKDKIRINEI